MLLIGFEGIEYFAKNKLHHQRTKDFFCNFVFFELHQPYDILTRKRSWPLLSKHQTFVNIFANVRKGPFAQEKKEPYFLFLPKRRRSHTWKSQLTLYPDILMTGTGIQTSSSLCPSVSSMGSSIGPDVTKDPKIGGQNWVSQWVILAIKKKEEKPWT